MLFCVRVSRQLILPENPKLRRNNNIIRSYNIVGVCTFIPVRANRLCFVTTRSSRTIVNTRVHTRYDTPEIVVVLLKFTRATRKTFTNAVRVVFVAEVVPTKMHSTLSTRNVIHYAIRLLLYDFTLFVIRFSPSVNVRAITKLNICKKIK